jgi:hypothetical protein
MVEQMYRPRSSAQPAQEKSLIRQAYQQELWAMSTVELRNRAKELFAKQKELTRNRSRIQELNKELLGTLHTTFSNMWAREMQAGKQTEVPPDEQLRAKQHAAALEQLATINQELADVEMRLGVIIRIARKRKGTRVPGTAQIAEA